MFRGGGGEYRSTVTPIHFISILYYILCWILSSIKLPLKMHDTRFRFVLCCKEPCYFTESSAFSSLCRVQQLFFFFSKNDILLNCTTLQCKSNAATTEGWIIYRVCPMILSIITLTHYRSLFILEITSFHKLYLVQIYCVNQSLKAAQGTHSLSIIYTLTVIETHNALGVLS